MPSTVVQYLRQQSEMTLRRAPGEARTLAPYAAPKRGIVFAVPAMLRRLTALALLGTAAGARPNIMMILVVRRSRTPLHLCLCCRLPLF